MILLLLMLQTAAVPIGGSADTPPPKGGERFSILCGSPHDDQAGDIVVCGNQGATSPRIPLRDFRGVPNHAVASNPDMRASVALDGAGVGNECGKYGEDCPVGLGGYVLPKAVSGAVSLAKSAFAKKPDKRGRVPIDLDGPKGTVTP